MDDGDGDFLASKASKVPESQKNCMNAHMRCTAAEMFTVCVKA